MVALHRLSGWNQPQVDFIPLLKPLPIFRKHRGYACSVFKPLLQRPSQESGDKQTIMLGFSDGTKDGGYFMAQWSI